MKIIIDLHTKKMPDVGNPSYAVRVVAGSSGEYPFTVEDIMCFEAEIVASKEDAGRFITEKVLQLIRTSSPLCFKGPNPLPDTDLRRMAAQASQSSPNNP